MLQMTMVVLLLLPFFNGNKKEQDRRAIKSMCGCYEVKFEYAETFASDPAYKRHDNYKTSGVEWVFEEEGTNDRLVLYHLLIVNDTHVIKHWREDWLYQNTAFYRYRSDLNWKFEKVPAEQVAGQWTQKVYQSDDGPRYEGSATWLHVDGKVTWESEADAPLPRREHTKRDDYNVLHRKNKLQLTEYGWLHEQDNSKIIRAEGKDRLLAMEKGYNAYHRLPEEECAAAIAWWQERRPYWLEVKAAWDEVLAEGRDLRFAKTVDGSSLSDRLFQLEKESMSAKSDARQQRAAIRAVIDEYLK